MRGRPTQIKGKELSSIHFEWREAIKLDSDTIESKTKALWTFLEKEGVNPEKIESLKKLCQKKRAESVWNDLEPYTGRIHIKGSGGAIAGLLIVEQLAKAQRIWHRYRRPYKGLQNLKGLDLESRLKDAITTADQMEQDIPEPEQESRRHYLALVINTLGKRADLAGWGRETIGKDSIDSEKNKILLISHGTQTRNSWTRGEKKVIDKLIKTTENMLSEEEKDQLNPWKR